MAEQQAQSTTKTRPPPPSSEEGKSTTTPTKPKLSLDKYKKTGVMPRDNQTEEEEANDPMSSVQGRLQARSKNPAPRETTREEKHFEKEVVNKMNYLMKGSFGYLDVFEKEQQERKQAYQEF